MFKTNLRLSLWAKSEYLSRTSDKACKVNITDWWGVNSPHTPHNPPSAYSTGSYDLRLDTYLQDIQGYGSTRRAEGNPCLLAYGLAEASHKAIAVGVAKESLTSIEATRPSGASRLRRTSSVAGAEGDGGGLGGVRLLPPRIPRSD